MISPQSGGEGAQLLICRTLALNVVSGVGIVLLNKYIVVRDGFNYMVVLSFCHFFFTFVCCQVARRFQYISIKEGIPLKKRLTLASASLGCVIFMNLNLAYNSVAFYQLTKLACIPVVLILEYVLYGDKVSGYVLLSLLIVTTGVGMATIKNAIVADTWGLSLAGVAILFTAFGQIVCTRYQRVYGYNSLQLLCSVCPFVALGMFVSIPFFHDVHTLAQANISLPLVLDIFISCVLALGVNITNYLVLGQTSPVTCQVLGHVKTLSILVLGFMFFNHPWNPRMVGGISVAVAGVILYSELKRRSSSSGSCGSSSGSKNTGPVVSGGNRKSSREGLAASCPSSQAKPPSPKSCKVMAAAPEPSKGFKEDR